MAGMNMIEKVLARASGAALVRPGDIVTCVPDQVLQIDAAFTIEGVWYAPTKVYDKDRVAVVFDHMVPAPTIKDAEGHIRGRAFAAEFDLDLLDVGDHGIVHVVAAERGFALPGELLVCTDSHT